MGTNIYIKSDFIEPYDKYLHDPMGKIYWDRFSRGGRNRREIFELLKNYVSYKKDKGDFGINVVPNGVVQELYDKYEERYVNDIYNTTWDRTGICSSFSELVIYKDEMAHRGEGKEVMDVEEAIIKCPDAYASVLLINKQNYSISHRDLFIGNRVYNLTYISITDSWRSNCGHVVIAYNGCHVHLSDYIWFTNRHGTNITSPIFSFDYIEIPVTTSQNPDGAPEKFYVDFNEAAGIPDEVVVSEYGNDRYGECIPFSEIISNEDISKLTEKSLKSEK